MVYSFACEGRSGHGLDEGRKETMPRDGNKKGNLPSGAWLLPASLQSNNPTIKHHRPNGESPRAPAK